MDKITWKCSECGYTFENEATAPPPDTCPGCSKKCEFLNVTCYVPECGMEGQDPRLG